MRLAWIGVLPTLSPNAPCMSPLGAAAFCMLAACTSLTPQRYTGTLTRTSGGCASSPATLVLRGGKISFAPTDGAQILPGTVTQDGHVFAGLTLKGANGKPFPQELEGTLTQTAFSGHFRSPECRAEVKLQAK